MRLEIVEALGVAQCPKCGKEIESTDFIDYVGSLVGIEVDECPHCSEDLSWIDEPEDWFERDEEDY